MTWHCQVHVIKIERVRRRAVDKCGSGSGQTLDPAKYGGAFSAALLLEFGEQNTGQLVGCASYATGDIIQHALPCPGASFRGNVGEFQGPGVFSQSPGQPLGLNVNDRVHWLPPSRPSAANINGFPFLVERTD